MSETIQYIVNVVGNAQGKLVQISQSATNASQSMTKLTASIAKIRDASIAMEGLTSIGDKIGNMFGSAFNNGLQAELQQQNLTTLLGGDVAAMENLYGQIAEYGKDTVYDKTGLLEATKTMMSFGISGEKAFSTLQNIGDIAMGDSNKMQSLALAFSQTTSTGKLMGQDLMQMINAGFNPLQVISDKTGKSMATLKDEMSKGAISADMVAQAFQWATEEGSLFYQGAEKAGLTTAGRINQLKDNVAELGITLFETLQPAINGVLKVATKFTVFMQENKTIVTTMGVIIGGLALAIKGASAGLAIYNTCVAAATAATQLWSAAQAVFNAIAAVNPITWIIMGIVALVAAITYVCYKIEGWGSLWDGICGFMKHTFFAFVENIKLAWTTVVNGIMIGLDAIKLGWYEFKEACGLGNSSENQSAIAKIHADIEARKKAITDGTKKIAEHEAKAVQALKGIKMSWGSDEKTESSSATIGTNSQLQSLVSTSTSSADASANMPSLGKSNEAIVTGGTRNTSITINLGEMIGSVTFNGSIEENKEDFERKLAESMFRVLAIAQSSVG